MHARPTMHHSETRIALFCTMLFTSGLALLCLSVAHRHSTLGPAPSSDTCHLILTPAFAGAIAWPSLPSFHSYRITMIHAEIYVVKWMCAYAISYSRRRQVPALPDPHLPVAAPDPARGAAPPHLISPRLHQITNTTNRLSSQCLHSLNGGPQPSRREIFLLNRPCSLSKRKAHACRLKCRDI